MGNRQPLGKQLEWKWREVRSYLTPGDYACFSQLKRNHHIADSEVRSGGKRLLLDFQDIRIDNVGGRYLYYVIHDFVAAGYTPFYRDRFRFVANIHSKGFKKHLLELPFHIYSNEAEVLADAETSVLITDTKNVLQTSSSSLKILVDYAMKRASAEKGEMPLSFSMSPFILKQGIKIPEVDITASRPIKFLFAGNLDPKVYDTKVLPIQYGMMNRVQMIDVFKGSSRSPNDLLCPKGQLSFEQIVQPREMVILDTRFCRVEPERWLELLSNADYFIAAPGQGMPLCHNMIEAMAVGCVPITASADYLTPSLEVGKNAVFLNDNFSELDRQTSCDVELKQMRQNVLDYFEQNLMPTSLAKRITSQPNHGRIVKFILNDYRIPR